MAANTNTKARKTTKRKGGTKDKADKDEKDDKGAGEADSRGGVGAASLGSSKCLPYAGVCANGGLAEPGARDRHGHCGSCNAGYRYALRCIAPRMSNGLRRLCGGTSFIASSLIRSVPAKFFARGPVRRLAVV